MYKREAAPVARNKYPEVTQEKILDAAKRLFLTKGYENTTIQDIVDALGNLTKGAEPAGNARAEKPARAGADDRNEPHSADAVVAGAD